VGVLDVVFVEGAFVVAGRDFVDVVGAAVFVVVDFVPDVTIFVIVTGVFVDVGEAPVDAPEGATTDF